MTGDGSIKKKLLKISFAGFIILALVFLIPLNGLAENKKPTAVIDGTLNAKVGGTIYLNADLSSDPDGNTLNYTWTVLSSPQGGESLGGRDQRFQFDANTAGRYEIQLVVNDGFADSDPATVTVLVTDSF